MSGSNEWPALLQQLETGETITPADFLIEARRIADALEAQVRPNACDELHKTGAKCVLDDRHVGHHTSGDGRLHWLDEE